MKKIVLLAALLPLVSVNAQKTELKTFEDSVAYAIGCDVAGGVRQMNIDYNMLIQGIADFSKNKNLFSPNDVKNILTEYQIRQQKGAQQKAEKNIEKGKKFLAENRNNKSVYQTESGLQYKIVKLGTGNKPNLPTK